MSNDDIAPVNFSDSSINPNYQTSQQTVMQESTQQQPQQEYDDSPAFLFSVSEPEKRISEGGLKLGYWSYKLTCNTRLPQYKSQTMICQRRYKDFLWLRDQLFNAFPGVIVPPLPEKSVMGTVEKFISSAVDSKALLEYRQRALTKFLTRVGEHPVLQTSKELQLFLELDEKSFEGQKAKPTTEAPASAGFFSSLLKKSTSKEPEFIVEQKKFIAKMEDQLKLLKERLHFLVEKRKEMSHALAEFSKSFLALGNVEKEFSEGTMSHSLIEISNKTEQLSVSTLTQADRETMQVIETITYYLGMCGSIKQITKTLEAMRLNRDDLGNQLKIARTNLEKGQQNPKTTEDKLKLLRQTVEIAESKEQASVTVTRNAEEAFLQDIERFDMERKVDFAYMLDAFVSLQVEYSTNLQKSWQALMPSIRMITEEGTSADFDNFSVPIKQQQQQQQLERTNQEEQNYQPAQQSPTLEDEYADYTEH